ncbi:hypothetical protein [Curtobacterium sp. MCSS17_007]|uniref:hypothetical protein n=1 Tax=Curtobacterium sp. MCSS17_007 TaxID=2175646 RepID=UPI000DA9038B|nr:hypothetical protein [Curtobacterium sp. MCSS17_007]WIE74511.1 hypothetical protein DEJ22_009470 [Curtobacterium sp. MCSS17_007]
MSKPLQQRTFNNINRYIKQVVKEGLYKAEKVAEVTGVSVSTVRAIKRLKTWKAYQAYLLARHTSRKTTPAEQTLINDLKEVQENPAEHEYVTLKQFNDAVAKLSGDVSNAKSVANIANGKADAAVKKSEQAFSAADDASTREHQNSGILCTIMQRKPGWFRRVQVETSDR